MSLKRRSNGRCFVAFGLGGKILLSCGSWGDIVVPYFMVIDEH
jgi:hypothetical protein